MHLYFFYVIETQQGVHVLSFLPNTGKIKVKKVRAKSGDPQLGDAELHDKLLRSVDSLPCVPG